MEKLPIFYGTIYQNISLELQNGESDHDIRRRGYDVTT
jgi:hypothetical protein